MFKRLPTLLLIAAFALPAPARAQGGAIPFENDLARLSEILGALHYLRALCGANEGQKWRAEMQALVEAEAPAGSPSPRQDGRELQSRLSRIPADLPHLHAARRSRHQALPRGRREDFARGHGPLFQLKWRMTLSANRRPLHRDMR